jgi:hypothetical protein
MLEDIYEELIKIRVLMDENPTKAKQQVTNLSNSLRRTLVHNNQ